MSNPATERFGKNMEALMHLKGVSYSELEKATGVPRSSLNEYARAKHAIPLKNALAIARFFGKTVEEMAETTMKGEHVPNNRVTQR